jgi:hypothetical protein
MDEANPTKPRFRRVVRTTAGFALLPVGVALLVLPGPGIPVVLGSLLLLEEEYPWAGKARERFKTLAHRGVRWLRPRAAQDESAR